MGRQSSRGVIMKFKPVKKISPEINLIHGDCLEAMNSLPNNSISCIITDPPYIHEKGGRGKMLLGESLDRDKFNMREL